MRDMTPVRSIHVIRKDAEYAMLSRASGIHITRLPPDLGLGGAIASIEWQMMFKENYQTIIMLNEVRRAARIWE